MRPAVTVGWRAGRNPALARRSPRRPMEKASDYLDAPGGARHRQGRADPYAANLEKLALPSVAEVVEAAKAVSNR